MILKSPLIILILLRNRIVNQVIWRNVQRRTKTLYCFIKTPKGKTKCIVLFVTKQTIQRNSVTRGSVKIAKVWDMMLRNAHRLRKSTLQKPTILGNQHDYMTAKLMVYCVSKAKLLFLLSFSLIVVPKHLLCQLKD